MRWDTVPWDMTLLTPKTRLPHVCYNAEFGRSIGLRFKGCRHKYRGTPKLRSAGPCLLKIGAWLTLTNTLLPHTDPLENGPFLCEIGRKNWVTCVTWTFQGPRSLELTPIDRVYRRLTFHGNHVTILYRFRNTVARHLVNTAKFFNPRLLMPLQRRLPVKPCNGASAQQ